jgi:hypothetical protein
VPESWLNDKSLDRHEKFQFRAIIDLLMAEPSNNKNQPSNLVKCAGYIQNRQLPTFDHQYREQIIGNGTGNGIVTHIAKIK